VLIGFLTLLQNPGFRQRLLRIADRRISSAMGAEIHIGDFGIHSSGLSPAIDLYSVVVNGAPPYPKPPLLEIDHLRITVQVTSLIHREWHFDDIVIDRPVVRVFMDSSGRSNLPKPPSRQGAANIFDLGVRHLILNGGNLHYNNRQSALNADLHDVDFQSEFTPASTRYSGELKYSNGRVHIQRFNPIVHGLDARFSATPEALTITRASLTSGSTKVIFRAVVRDFAEPTVTATYQGVLDSNELARIVRNPDLPSGIVHAAGSLQYRHERGHSVLQMIDLEGNLSSPQISVDSSGHKTSIRDVSARYGMKDGNAHLRDIRAVIFGGRLAGALTIHDLSGSRDAELQTDLRGVQLSELQQFVHTETGGPLWLRGTANASIAAAWHNTLDTLSAQTDATLDGTIAPGQTASPFPIRGEVHARYSAPADQVSFTRTYVQMPETSLRLSGTVNRRSSLQVEFRSTNLSEVETVADAFGAVPQPLGLQGTASFTGTVQGTLTTPHIAGQVSAPVVEVKGTTWRSLHAGIDASPSHLNLHNGGVQPSAKGRITFDARLGLDHWAYDDTQPLEVDLNASQLAVADIEKLVGRQTRVSGTLSAAISLRGSQRHPEGHGHISLTQADVAGEPVDSATLTFRGTGNEIRSDFALQMAAGSVKGSFAYLPGEKRYSGSVRATGMTLAALHILQTGNLDVAGILNLTATGSGTLDNPELQLTANVPHLQIQQQALDDVTLKAVVADHLATVALNSTALGTFVRGNGTVRLTGDYEADATLETSPISMEPIFAAYFPSQSSNISGETELHATLKGPLQDLSRVNAHIVLPRLSLSYRETVHIAAVKPVQLDYLNGELRLQRTEIRGTDTDLELQASIPVKGGGPAALLAEGTIDLHIAQALDPDLISSGQLVFNVNGYVRQSTPNVQGQIRIVNAAFAGGDIPLGLRNANGTLNLTNDRIEIQQFQAQAGGGTITAAGNVKYRPSFQFTVVVDANDIHTLYPQGVRERIGANLTLTGTPGAAILSGRAELNELSFSPTFDLAAVLSQVSGTSTVPPQGFARNLKLDVVVHSTSDLNVATGQLSLQGSANLQVRGTAAEPVVLGRVVLTGGDVIFRGNRYVIQPSSLDFMNPYRIEPRLNVAIDTAVQDYDIHMLFRGPMDQIRTTYTSEPALPPADIINLLVFGKTEEASQANPTPGNLGAESLIASSVSGQVTSRIAKITGISQLSIDPIVGGNQDVGARVTVQQRVTGSLLVTFSADATTTQRDIVKLEYQPQKGISVTGIRDQNGGLSLDIRFRKVW
jgi:translocation and assembly module TamB